MAADAIRAAAAGFVMGGEFSGALRERIAIVRRDGARDALAGASGDWATVGEAWASVVPMRPGAVNLGDALASPPRWMVLMRRQGTLPQVGDRIAWRGKNLRVRYAEADPRTPDRLVAGTEEER